MRHCIVDPSTVIGNMKRLGRETTKNEQTEFNDGPARGAFGTRRPARCCCLLLLLPTAQRDDEAVEEARAVAISVSESRKRETKRERERERRTQS